MQTKFKITALGLVLLLLTACGAAPAASSAPVSTVPERTRVRLMGLGGPTTIGMVKAVSSAATKIETERRSYISARMLSAPDFAAGVRGHWGIENRLHWTLDVTFNEDQSRLRIGHGAKNMAVVRHFALNLVRQVADKRSIKRRRKCAAFDPEVLMEILGPLRR